MPTEIQTNLCKLRELDIKLQVLEKHTDRLIDEYLKNKFPSEAKKKERLRYIESLHAKANRYAENKVKLSYETYELVDKNIKRLDLCMARFENEIEQNAAIIAMAPIHHYDAKSISATSERQEKQMERLNQKMSSISCLSGNDRGSVSSTSNCSTSSNDSSSSSSSSSSSESSSGTTGTDITSTSSSEISSSTSSNSSISDDRSNTNSCSSGIRGKNSSKTSTDSGRGSRKADSKKGRKQSRRAIKKRKKGTANASSGEDRPTKTKLKKQALAAPRSELLNVKSGLPDDMYHMPIDPHEPLYCVCRQVSYGEMIACDDPECLIEWFHFPCVGLKIAPRGEWYCEECIRNRNKLN
ncbi:PREDICTED: inhibitor of growth protein 4-like [Ceratosolen solmsi marchali]|uniref:Inhibitor of growth protein n=1 Tax=Ceratosolen solmsi marchali TaxID=326594 RepID=A0AAJ6VLQ0_9HYME|nr:PREDICTED: inhibitor of growth protein 4-like [Ceratosolen solmsi marchali]